MIDWRRVPRQVLIDALRNCPGNTGLGNLSRQDKADLVAAAQRLIAAGHADSFQACLAARKPTRREIRALLGPCSK